MNNVMRLIGLGVSWVFGMGLSLKAATVTFEAAGGSTEPGGTITVPVKVAGFSTVTSFQFTVGWDQTVLQHVSNGEFGVTGLASGNFGTSQIANGKLTVSWDDPDQFGKTLADGTTLFSLAFTAIGANGSSSEVSFENIPTVKEVTVDLEVQTFGVSNGTVTVGDGTPVNTPPTITEISDKSIIEGTAASAIGFTVADSETDTDQLSVTGTSSNTTLVPSSNITFNGTAENRSVTVAPVASQSGETTITLRVTDVGGLFAETSFIITVSHVNVAPSFTKGVDQTVAENAGAQTVSNWATNISAGAAVESGQTLSFQIASNNNNAMFAAQPAISSSGTLTYTPAANASGSATLTVVLKDDGGTANGGVDTSETQTFIVHVIEGNSSSLLAVNDLFANTVSLNEFSWARSIDSSSFSRVQGVDVDESGNSYAVGWFEGTATVGGSTLVSSGSHDILVVKLNAQGNFVWAKQFGGSSSDQGLGISVDQSGNSYVTGYFQDGASFGNVTLTGQGQAFVLKLDSGGNVLWAVQAGGDSSDVGFGVAVDTLGNSYVTGYFNLSANFEGTTLTSNGSGDVFVMKLDSSGSLVWVTQAGGTGFDQSRDIVVDSLGNSYVIGSFSDTATFGNIAITSNGFEDAFVMKLTSDGSVVWVRGGGGTGSDQGFGIAVDGLGNSYATGSFDKTATFEDRTLTSRGFLDVFVIKVNNEGHVVWFEQAGGGDYDFGQGIDADDAGNSYVTGPFGRGEGIFGEITLTATQFHQDVFVMKLDNGGKTIWAEKAGGTLSEHGLGIATDSSGTSFVTGLFVSAESTFGETTLANPTGTDHGFVAKLTDKIQVKEDAVLVLDVLSNDIGPEGVSLSIITVTQGAHGSVTINAGTRVTYTPEEDYSGTDTFTYTLSDGNGGTSTATATLTLAPVNDPPTLDLIGDPDVINKNSGTKTVNLTGITAGGGEAQALSVSATSSNPGLIPTPTVNYTGPNTTGSLSFSPTVDQIGSTIITVIVTDAGLDGDLGTADDNGTLSRTFTVTVEAVNSLPSILNSSDHPQNQSITEGQTVTFNVTASGDEPLSYQWRKDGVSIAGASSASYTISNAQNSDAGDYTVVITNASGSVTSNSAV